jgi:hypothetical protein
MDSAPSFFGINTMLAELSQWKFSEWRLEKSKIDIYVASHVGTQLLVLADT